MLTDFDKDLAGIDLKADNALELILAAANTRSDGLSNKNTELLNKLSGNKDQSASSAAELEALQQFKLNADVQTAEDAKNWKEADKLRDESHKAELLKRETESQSDKSLIKTLLIDNGLSDALDSVKINPVFKTGAVAMLHSQVIISDGKAMIGDKTLSEAVKEWADSDIGKAYTLAAKNNGTGSLGNNGNLDSSKKWSDYSAAELSGINKTDPDEYKRLKETR